MNDLKFAFRQLLKNPGFTAVAALTLALGIGANTAIFSFVNTILLRPLPFMEPERLVMVYTSYQANDSHKNWVAAPTFNEWRKQSTAFEGLAARSFDGFVLTGKGQPENIPGSRLSANIFRYHAAQTLDPDGDTYPSHKANVHLYTRREPLGVVTVITPWNFPICIAARWVSRQKSCARCR